MTHEENPMNKKRENAFNKIKEIAKSKEVLPYLFAEINKPLVKNFKQIKLNQLEQDEEILNSGYLDCSMYLLNDLIVGNEHKEEDRKYTEIKALKVNNQILISPYTLKGCISNFLSAYLNIPIKRVNQRGFLFRPNLNFSSSNRIQLAFGIIPESNSSDQALNIIRISDLDTSIPVVYSYNPKSKIENNIKGNKLEGFTFSAGYEFYKGKYKIRKDGQRVDEFSSFFYQNGLDGNGLLADRCPTYATSDYRPNHNTISVKRKCIVETPMLISAEVLSQYRKTYDILIKDHFTDNPSDISEIEKNKVIDYFKTCKTLKKGEIIFFEYDRISNEILTFGKTYYYPWAFHKGLNSSDFPQDIRNEFDLSIIEEMFGYSFLDNDRKNNSKSGKIHFNYAVPKKDYSEHISKKKFSRPGGPKASSYEFYLRQNNNRITAYGEVLNYEGDNIRLSGRKFYRRTYQTASSTSKSVDQHNEKYQIILNDVIKVDTQNMKELPVFTFRVHFENLTEWELNLLVFALEIEKTTYETLHEKVRSQENVYCHQIGYGKNKGMGAVRIIIDHQRVFRGHEMKEHKYSIDLNKLLNQCTFKDIFKIINKNNFNYPVKPDRKGKESIPYWHSEVRNAYAILRREDYGK